MRVPAVSFLLGVPLFAAGSIPAGADHLLAFPRAAGAGLSLARPGADGGAASCARPHARDRSASFLLINNLIGVGLGSMTIGKLSDMLTPAYGDDALRHAILIGLGFYLLAAALMMAGGGFWRGNGWSKGDMVLRRQRVSTLCNPMTVDGALWVRPCANSSPQAKALRG
jgi:hypothetical protein